jgi:hypothetical protein
MKKAVLIIALLASLLTFAGCKSLDRSAAGSNVLTIQVHSISVGNHTNYGGGGGGGFTGGGGGFGGFGTFIGGGGGLTGGIGGTVIVVVVALIFFAMRSRQGRGGGMGGPMNVPPLDIPPLNPDSQGDIISAVTEHDPGFEPERFIAWAKQVFVQLQSAWTERDWKKVRPFESEELFNLHRTQLEEFIRNGTINIMENVCVNEAYLYDYKAEGDYEYLTVFMQTRYNDYVIREDTKQVVKGDPNTTYNVDYTLRFMRSLGVQTGERSNASTTKCPNCGAPVDVNAAGQCSYCGTVITSGHHDWVLCNLDDIR